MLIEGLSYKLWNKRIRQLAQTMCGLISPNFRKVTIGYDGKKWLLNFYLEKEDIEDMNAIEEAIRTFRALHDDEFSHKVIVTNEPYIDVKKDGYVQYVFSRRIDPDPDEE
jgi:hypothetical protein